MTESLDTDIEMCVSRSSELRVGHGGAGGEGPLLVLSLPKGRGPGGVPPGTKNLFSLGLGGTIENYPSCLNTYARRYEFAAEGTVVASA